MAGEALYYGTGRRKNAVARVRLVPGTGKVTINGREGAEYFGREALLDYAKTPFKVTDTMDHFDVIARINGGGISGQAGALRHGISRALLDAGDYRAELKKAGYLTRDSRVVERKKYGLKKARKRPQFSKRSFLLEHTRLQTPSLIRAAGFLFCRVGDAPESQTCSIRAFLLTMGMDAADMLAVDVPRAGAAGVW